MDPKPGRVYHALALSWTSPVAEEHVERLLAEVDEFRVTAIDEDPITGAIRFFFSDAERRDAAEATIRAIDASVRITPIDVSDENWAERSQASITRVRVGEIVVAPPWDVPRDHAPAIVIQPSMGFGTAHHESTRLCLQLLQEIDVTGQSVLDLGTGSGVLAIAARKRGASIVVAADYDPDAIQSAQENLELNHVEEISLLVLDLAEPSALGPRAFDLVFANLTGAVLQRYAEEITRRVAPGGALITSGVTADEEAAVVDAFARTGLAASSRLQEREWIGTTFTHTQSRT